MFFLQFRYVEDLEEFLALWKSTELFIQNQNWSWYPDTSWYSYILAPCYRIVCLSGVISWYPAIWLTPCPTLSPWSPRPICRIGRSFSPSVRLFSLPPHPPTLPHKYLHSFNQEHQIFIVFITSPNALRRQTLYIIFEWCNWTMNSEWDVLMWASSSLNIFW